MYFTKEVEEDGLMAVGKPSAKADNSCGASSNQATDDRLQ